MPDLDRVQSEMASDTATHSEGLVAKAIEKQTAKLPSDVFLWAAFGSIAVSAALQIAGRHKVSNFIGQWAPTILILGVYNKIVKVMGSDAEDMEHARPTIH